MPNDVQQPEDEILAEPRRHARAFVIAGLLVLIAVAVIAVRTSDHPTEPNPKPKRTTAPGPAVMASAVLLPGGSEGLSAARGRLVFEADINDVSQHRLKVNYPIRLSAPELPKSWPLTAGVYAKTATLGDPSSQLRSLKPDATAALIVVLRPDCKHLPTIRTLGGLTVHANLSASPTQGSSTFTLDNLGSSTARLLDQACSRPVSRSTPRK